MSMLMKILSQAFDMKNLGNAKQILSMHITHDMSNGCIYLSQSKYISKIFKRFNMESEKL